MSTETSSAVRSTRRGHVSYGGALVVGSLLAGCAGETGPGPTSDSTAAATATYDVAATTAQVEQSIGFDSAASVSTDVESRSEASLFGTPTFVTGILLGGVVVGALFGFRGWRNRGGR